MFKALFRRQTSASSGEATSDRRHQQRQALLAGLAVIELNEGTCIDVTDISYGGIGALMPPDLKVPRKMKRVPMSLSVLGQRIDTDLDLVHTRGQKLGFAFRQREAEACLNIETLVDRLKDGADLRESERHEANARLEITLTNNRGVVLTVIVDARTATFVKGYLSFFQWGQERFVSYGASHSINDLVHDDLRSALLILVGAQHPLLATALPQMLAAGLERLQAGVETAVPRPL